MNKKFINILKNHESDDILLTASEDKIKLKIIEEFINGNEIIEIANKNNINCKDFFIKDDFPQDWTVIPIRTNSLFDIHKLTTSQRPYFHNHDFYEMIYIYRGQCSQIFRNPDGSLVLDSRKICLLRPGLIHAVGCCGKSDIILKLIIPQDIYESCFSDLLEWDTAEYYKVFETNEQVEYIIFKLMEEKFNRQLNECKAENSYLILLLIELLRLPSCVDSELNYQIAQYLSSNLIDATLRGFAEYMGYSAGYLSRMIKKKNRHKFYRITR